MGSKGSTPQEDPAAKALRKRQVSQLLELDDEANTRIKRVLSSAQGLRIARGSADSRIPRGDSTMSPAASSYGLKQSDARGYAGSGLTSGKRKSKGRQSGSLPRP